MKTPNIEYQQIEPKNETLKKLVKVYYIHKSTVENRVERITYFPNYATTINIYKNSAVKCTAYSRTHTYHSNKKFLKLLVGKFDKSREIIMKGPFDKLTIVFHPLGLNHFLSPLSKYVEDHFSLFNEFGESFDETLEKVFATNSIELKRDHLDAYLTKKYIGFEAPKLTHAVHKILNDADSYSIAQIATELKISRKTLLRLFKKHLAISPSEYKSIAKLRKAINFYKKNANQPKLSTLAYESLYYDQSDLNHHFKEKTGLTPKDLFNKIQTIEHGLYWLIDK